jgi:hypothetical protein
MYSGKRSRVVRRRNHCSAPYGGLPEILACVNALQQFWDECTTSGVDGEIAVDHGVVKAILGKDLRRSRYSVPVSTRISH